MVLTGIALGIIGGMGAPDGAVDFVVQRISDFSGSPTCSTLTVTDGDTIKCDGQRMRLLGDGAPHVKGFDTPEIGRAKCNSERVRGLAAKKRLEELLATREYQIEDSGEVDRFDRPLIWIRFSNSKTAGEILMREGHAVEWTPDYEPGWC